MIIIHPQKRKFNSLSPKSKINFEKSEKVPPAKIEQPKKRGEMKNGSHKKLKEKRPSLKKQKIKAHGFAVRLLCAKNYLIAVMWGFIPLYQ